MTFTILKINYYIKKVAIEFTDIYDSKFSKCGLCFIERGMFFDKENSI